MELLFKMDLYCSTFVYHAVNQVLRKWTPVTWLMTQAHLPTTTMTSTILSTRQRLRRRRRHQILPASRQTYVLSFTQARWVRVTRPVIGLAGMYLQSVNIHRHTVNQKPERKKSFNEIFTEFMCRLHKFLQVLCLTCGFRLKGEPRWDSRITTYFHNLLHVRGGRVHYTHAAANASYERDPC